MVKKLFKVLSIQRYYEPRAQETNCFILVPDGWDDFGQFSTNYILWHYIDFAVSKRIGEVKIGQFGMGDGHPAGEPDAVNRIRRPALDETFQTLDPSIYFSLGQDEGYYETLKSLGNELRLEVLTALNDLALNIELFERVLLEPVVEVSLLRNVTKETVRGQFKRLARGKRLHVGYKFTYVAERAMSFRMTFEVEPQRNIPSNLHVIIGSNGAGKTNLLNAMTRSLIARDFNSRRFGRFEFEGVGDDAVQEFSQLVSVSFSAFDQFEPVSTKSKSASVGYCYIGLRKLESIENREVTTQKTPSDLAAEFGTSLVNCSKTVLSGRWCSILEPIADQFFQDTRVRELFLWDNFTSHSESDKAENAEASARIFEELSAGHKIVLLTLTKLVEMVAETTLVFIDEPETHLHPPLLSAFLRAITALLVERNGVAVIATHSPVVLQEVPSDCVWVLTRAGDERAVHHPRIQTFAENVGVLTNEVFHLETTYSGFHQRIKELAATENDYESILSALDGKVGAEGRALIKAILKDNERKSI